MTTAQIQQLLGADEALLSYKATAIPKETLHLPGPDFVDRIFQETDRNSQVLRSLKALHSTGRLANTGYLSILPVDQGVEHSAGASFAANPVVF